MSDSPAELSSEDLRRIRQGLGVTGEWLARHLRIDPCTLDRWEAGTRSPQNPDQVLEALNMLEMEQREHVDRHVEAFTARRPKGLPPLLAIEEAPGGDSNDDWWPAGWQRAVALKVREYVPDLVIVDAHPPSPNDARRVTRSPTPQPAQSTRESQRTTPPSSVGPLAPITNPDQTLMLFLRLSPGPPYPGQMHSDSSHGVFSTCTRRYKGGDIATELLNKSSCAAHRG